MLKLKSLAVSEVAELRPRLMESSSALEDREVVVILIETFNLELDLQLRARSNRVVYDHPVET